MALAIITQMATTGSDPRTCEYHLTDIDPMAVALAGVNLSARGIPHVVLRAENALSPDNAT